MFVLSFLYAEASLYYKLTKQANLLSPLHIHLPQTLPECPLWDGQEGCLPYRLFPSTGHRPTNYSLESLCSLSIFTEDWAQISPTCTATFLQVYSCVSLGTVVWLWLVFERVMCWSLVITGHRGGGAFKVTHSERSQIIEWADLGRDKGSPCRTLGFCNTVLWEWAQTLICPLASCLAMWPFTSTVTQARIRSCKPS